MSKPIDYRFRTSVELESLDEVLVNYLKNKDTGLSEREKVFGAASAYWLPLALKQQGNYCESQLKYHAKTAIYRLLLHINYLADNFALEESSYLAGLMQAQTTSMQKQASQLLLESESNEHVEANTPDLAIEQEMDEQVKPTYNDLIHHPDDSTFAQIFN